MNIAKKILVLCFAAAMMCVPAYADDEAIDTSLIMYGSAALTVNVDGELSNTLSGTYTPGDIVTITAPTVSGKTFNYWTDSSGATVSYNSALTLVIHADTVLNAVYDDPQAAAQPYAGFLSITRTSGRIMFNVLATAPSGSTITDYGIRYSTTKNNLAALMGDDGVTVESADNPAASNWLFGAAASEDKTYYVIAYAIADGTTYYSEMKAVTLPNLSEGVSAVVMLANLLMSGNVDFDNISPDIIANLQASLFTVSFDANNGTGAMPPQGFLSGLEAALTANTFTRTYYTFNGWNTEANGSGTAYADGATVNISANTRLYAQWGPISYALTYTLNGAKDPGNPASYTVEDTVTLKAPTKDAYTFTGWTGADITGLSTTVTIPKGSTGARSYTANFTPTVYTITYELDEGTNDPDNPASYDIETPTITLKDPTKEGCDFAGWTMDGFAVTEIPKGSSGDKTITANWGDTAPVLSAASYSLSAKEGEPANLTINAIGLNLTWSLDGALPAGLEFTSDSDNASISGTPEAGTAGSYSLKVIAANNGGTASADVMITVAGAGTDDQDGKNRDIEKSEPVTTVSDSGASTTRTTTTMKDSEGNVLLAAEIAITTESEEFAAVVGEEFSTRVNVDVSLDIRIASYDSYAYLMEIFGLPEWLKADGTLESSGKPESAQHYEVTLSGTPVVSQDAQSLVFAATVRVTGDTPELEAYGDKEIMLAVNAKKISPDVSPDVSLKLSASQEALSVKRGESISITVTAVNGENITWSDSGNLPDGVNAQGDGNTFTISGTVAESAAFGSYSYTVSAENSEGSASITITITVRQAAYEPVNEQQTTANEINSMTSEELQEKFGNADGIKINGKVGNLDELIEKISSVTEIKTLDLSEAEDLEEVKLSGNSTIVSLTLSGNTAVKTVDMSGTKGLAVLNADNCAGLTELRCANCSIEELELDGCDALEILDCRNNKLHKLDAYMLESLYELLCSNQNITGWMLGREFDFMEYFEPIVSAADGVSRSGSGVGNVKNLKAWDAEGNALTVSYDSETGKAVFGEAPAKITYDYDTGFEGVMMDVTVVSAGSDEPDSGNVSSSGSGGGCDAGAVNAALGMIAVMMLLAFRRKS